MHCHTEFGNSTSKGVVVSKAGGSVENMATRLKYGRQVVGRLRKIWNLSAFTKKTKVSLLISLLSMVMHSCETWKMTKAIK